MLKKVTTTIIIIILICLVFANQKCYAICNTIRAKKEISAIKLTLNNGQTLYDFEVKQSGISSGVLNPAQLQNTRSLDLIFLIDTDSSDLNAEKNIVKTAIDSFKNLYSDNGLSKLNVGIIGFNNNSMSSSEFSSQTLNMRNIASQESEIINELNNLNNNKNMNILQATELADTKLGSYGLTASKQQVVFIISDGIATNDNTNVVPTQKAETICFNTRSKLKNMMEQKMTSVYALITTKSGFETVLSGLETFTREREFKDLIYEVMKQGTFYNQIVDNLVQSNDIILDAKADNILVGDKIFLFLDPEIAHGATLQIEYVITVSALNGIEGYTVEEDLTNSNLKFRADNNLLTENKTNGQVGWRYANGKLVKTGRGGTTEKIKIVLSTVISSEDFRYTYKNKAMCGIKSVGLGESVATGYSVTVESPEVSIIPPFGDGNTYEAKIKQYAPMIITLIVTTGVVIFLITKKKK